MPFKEVPDYIDIEQRHINYGVPNDPRNCALALWMMEQGYEQALAGGTHEARSYYYSYHVEGYDYGENLGADLYLDDEGEQFMEDFDAGKPVGPIRLKVMKDLSGVWED